MPRFAANLSLLFTELPFLDRFAAASAAGFSAVEFMFPYAFDAAEIRARLDATGLELVLFNIAPGDWDAGERGIAILPDRADEFRASIDQALSYARQLRCTRLHCLAGIIPDGADPPALRSRYIENLRHAASACAPDGVTLLIEPINTRDMPGYFLHHTAAAAAIIAEVGAPNLKLQYDAYHMHIMEGRLTETIAALLPLIGHVQIADAPGRHEPGTGEIDFPGLFAQLDRIGYAGWVGCEYRPAGNTQAGLDWLRLLTPSTPR